MAEDEQEAASIREQQDDKDQKLGTSHTMALC